MNCRMTLDCQQGNYLLGSSDAELEHLIRQATRASRSIPLLGSADPRQTGSKRQVLPQRPSSRNR